MVAQEEGQAETEEKQGATFILDIRRRFIQCDKVMKTKTLLSLFAVTFAGLVIAQAPRVYTAVEAGKHVGETATVTDKVDAIHQSTRGPISLDMGGKDPNQAFTAFIPAASVAQFSRPQRYQGRTVAVSGKIVLYKGKPGIAVNSPSQIVAR